MEGGSGRVGEECCVEGVGEEKCCGEGRCVEGGSGRVG